MSMRQHGDAALRGWDGPYYPVFTPRLGEALTSRTDATNVGALETALRSVSGYVDVMRPLTTADGYNWLSGFEFNVYDGKVLVAIPHSRDTSRADGSPLDRAPAVYTQGVHVNIEMANTVMARVIRALLQGPGRRPILTGP